MSLRLRSEPVTWSEARSIGANVSGTPELRAMQAVQTAWDPRSLVLCGVDGPMIWACARGLFRT